MVEVTSRGRDISLEQVVRGLPAMLDVGALRTSGIGYKAGHDRQGH